MTWDYLISILGVISVVCGIITFFIARKTASKTDGEKSGILYTELGYIKSGIDDIKKKQDVADDRYLEMTTRLTKVEQSVESAHQRIDSVEKRIL